MENGEIIEKDGKRYRVNNPRMICGIEAYELEEVTDVAGGNWPDDNHGISVSIEPVKTRRPGRPAKRK